MHIPDLQRKLDLLFAKSAERGGAIDVRRKLEASLGWGAPRLTGYIRGTDSTNPESMKPGNAGAICRVFQTEGAVDVRVEWLDKSYAFFEACVSGERLWPRLAKEATRLHNLGFTPIEDARPTGGSISEEAAPEGAAVHVGPGFQHFVTDRIARRESVHAPKGSGAIFPIGTRAFIRMTLGGKWGERAAQGKSHVVVIHLEDSAGVCLFPEPFGDSRLPGVHLEMPGLQDGRRADPFVLDGPAGTSQLFAAVTSAPPNALRASLSREVDAAALEELAIWLAGTPADDWALFENELEVFRELSGGLANARH